MQQSIIKNAMQVSKVVIQMAEAHDILIVENQKYIEAQKTAVVTIAGLQETIKDKDSLIELQNNTFVQQLKDIGNLKRDVVKLKEKLKSKKKKRS